MTVTMMHCKNGHAQERNGHAPASRLAGVVPPLDPVSTVDEPKPAADAKPAPEGRTAKGTFAPGNKFARGNPVARRMANLRASLLECATPERMKALGEELFAAALNGDWVAAKLLLTYAVGKAPEAVNADRLDLDEWNIANAAPTFVQFMRALYDNLPPALATILLRRKTEEGDPVARIMAMQEELHAEQKDMAAGGVAGRLHQHILKERQARIGK